MEVNSMKSVPLQLTEIYYKEGWHKTRLSYGQAYNYHKQHYENGDIVVYQKDGEVLGYYERYLKDDVCNLHNVYIKEECRNNEVFKGLYRQFFKTMPKHIKYIEGEKQKDNGQFHKVIITKGRGNYGRH